MSIKIEINEIEAQRMIQFYEQEKKKVQDKIQPLQRELDSIEATMMDIKKKIVQVPNHVPYALVADAGYNVSWTWISKAAYLLKEAHKPLTATIIVSEIMKREPSANRTTAMRSISSALSTYADKNRIFSRRKNSYGQWNYGLLEWDKNEGQNQS